MRVFFRSHVLSSSLMYCVPISSNKCSGAYLISKLEVIICIVSLLVYWSWFLVNKSDYILLYFYLRFSVFRGYIKRPAALNRLRLTAYARIYPYFIHVIWLQCFKLRKRLIQFWCYYHKFIYIGKLIVLGTQQMLSMDVINVANSSFKISSIFHSISLMDYICKLLSYRTRTLPTTYSPLIDLLIWKLRHVPNYCYFNEYN